MRKRTGFTLIELLAVIVILAVIALIATPLIMGVIEDAKKGSFKDTAHGIMKAAELKVGRDQLDGMFSGISYSVTGNDLDYKGTKPSTGTVAVDRTGRIAIEATNGTYCASKGFNDKDVAVENKTGACDGSNLSAMMTSNISNPVIKDGMTAVTYDSNGKTIVADTNSKWYDYDSKKWANAVSVTSTSRNKYMNATAGTEVLEADILGYFVWIPRYRYQLWNAEGGISNEQEIKVEFERVSTAKSMGTKNTEWLTHPAFTFGTCELDGLWIGKFELTGTAANPTTKPNSQSLTNLNMKEMFDSIHLMSTTNNYGMSSYDAHMMKNMEWGAVAYLTQSMYGRCTDGVCTEVWMNNVDTGNEAKFGPSITGCAGASVSAAVMNNMTACESGRDYKQAGVNASTTGNITGIYDTSGGVWDEVMASVKDADGTFISGGSGFTTMPDSKYYDNYEYNVGDYNFSIGKLGDAIKEPMKIINKTISGWYQDYSYMPVTRLPWIYRGGSANNYLNAGSFSTSRSSGANVMDYGSRAVVVSES